MFPARGLTHAHANILHRFAHHDQMKATSLKWSFASHLEWMNKKSVYSSIVRVYSTTFLLQAKHYFPSIHFYKESPRPFDLHTQSSYNKLIKYPLTGYQLVKLIPHPYFALVSVYRSKCKACGCRSLPKTPAPRARRYQNI
ncbi:hypothetical protein AOL_s00078g488 [Orbilia oligospora ATCC 24927]|uniref:Uncharacterized protein n=1 Tax=Arthrobotrys oligospora (strain ATCC 24927 / CBS 115.81 / DSM 1491) TaxID=756982 RepID=G1XC41_ARTOA|nr:hypothetical protein AOL_s00078g488 [Orbilia oligospora ATCC 24927]EGX49455.1 hypothetical protein AOL_s00078g488 [Orbilia oligospora ATCC 24927]